MVINQSGNIKNIASAVYSGCLTRIQVPLGVLLKSETKHEDMISIMDSLEQYVPLVKYTTDEKIASTEEEVEVQIYGNHTTSACIISVLLSQVHHDIFKLVLLGGDQLTVARARGSQQIRVNSETASDRLCGFIPVAEDWHTSVVLLTVSCIPSVHLQIHAHVGNFLIIATSWLMTLYVIFNHLY